MTDDLAGALREAGHADIADALERKQLANRLREGGREDLAEQLEAGKTPAAPVSEADQQFFERIKSAAESQWTSTEFF